MSEFSRVIGESEVFNELDRRFAELMLELAGSQAPELWFAAALVSRQTRAQHVCLELNRLAEPDFIIEVFEEETPPELPKPDQVRSVLQQASVVGKPGDFQPLILDAAGRLYLNRYWQYENELAAAVRSRIEPVEAIDAKRLRPLFEKYFETSRDKEPDWQMIAAVMALHKRLCVISGGPGTGKTRTVGVVLALLIEQYAPDKPVIRLTAPTGKAAVRLQHAIKKIKSDMAFPEQVETLIPDEATTLHRLLGYRRHSPYFRHNPENPLEVDVVVVDEASMVSLPLMAKLTQALPGHARLILLGDHDQLASVQAGAVLADLCDAGAGNVSLHASEQIRALTSFEVEAASSADRTVMSDCVVFLKKNYRFGNSAILQLSTAVNSGDEKAVFEILDNSDEQVQWPGSDALAFKQRMLRLFRDYPKSLDADVIFDEFEIFRILCAVRHGPMGVQQLNQLIEDSVRQRQATLKQEWYPGQPVLITRNDYTLELYNGDVGILLPDEDADGDLRAFFKTPDGFRKIRPFRLPEFEPAYAMTVHKSQGSEYDQIVLVLPDKDVPILTRELIYTGVTRASKKVEIWGEKDILKAAIQRRVVRSSGLREALPEKKVHVE